MSKHTPTPYYINGCYGIYAKHTTKNRWIMWNVGQTVSSYHPEKLIARIMDINGGSVDEKVANAEFFIRACNNHDALVEALDGLLNDPDGKSCVNSWDNRMYAKQTLAKAKE